MDSELELVKLELHKDEELDMTSENLDNIFLGNEHRIFLPEYNWLSEDWKEYYSNILELRCEAMLRKVALKCTKDAKFIKDVKCTYSGIDGSFVWLTIDPDPKLVSNPELFKKDVYKIGAMKWVSEMWLGFELSKHGNLHVHIVIDTAENISFGRVIDKLHRGRFKKYGGKNIMHCRVLKVESKPVKLKYLAKDGNCWHVKGNMLNGWSPEELG